MHSNNKIDFVHYVHYNNNNEMPTDITVKLPLKLGADDLLAKPRRGRLPTRPPNNFLIFRTAYTRVLQSRGHWDLRMREVTSHAARAWALASPEVKLECKKLANYAKTKHEEVYGPTQTRPRRRRQNDNNNNNNSNNNKRNKRNNVNNINNINNNNNINNINNIGIDINNINNNNENVRKDHLPLSLSDNNLQIEDCSSSTSTTPPTPPPPIQDVVASIYFDDMMGHNYSQACEWPEHHHIGYEMSFSSSGSDLGENVHRYTTTIYPSG